MGIKYIFTKFSLFTRHNFVFISLKDVLLFVSKIIVVTIIVI